MATGQDTYRIGKYFLKTNDYGVWARAWYDEKSQQTKRVSLRTKDFQEARDKLDEWFVENMSQDDSLVLSKDLPVATCLMEYWNDHAQHLKRSDAERRNLSVWNDFFDGDMVSEVRPRTQKKFIAYLAGHEKQYAKSTVIGFFKTGKAAIEYCLRNDLIQTIPPFIDIDKELKKYNLRKGERWRALDFAEIVDLLNHLESDMVVRYIIIMLSCACRPSAANELMGSQIDTDFDVVDLLPADEEMTNKRKPTVKLTSMMKAIYHPENIVTQSPEVVSLERIRKDHWNKARDKAGLDSLVVGYSMRYTIARWLRATSVDPWHTSSQLGHRSKGYEITEIYAPNDPGFLEKALTSIEGFLSILYTKCDRLQQLPELKNYKPRSSLVPVYAKIAEKF